MTHAPDPLNVASTLGTSLKSPRGRDQQKQQHVDQLNHEAWARRDHNETRLQALVQKARAQAEMISYEAGLVHSQVTLAYHDVRQRRYDVALERLFGALRWQQADASSPWLVRIYGVLAMTFDALGERAKAQLYASKQLELSRLFSQPDEETWALYTHALLIDEPKARLSALESVHERGMAHARPEVCVFALYHIASDYFALGQYEHALIYADQALTKASAASMDYAEMLSLTLLSRCHQAVGDTKAAIDLFQGALLSDGVVHPSCLLTLAELHLGAKRTADAEAVLGQLKLQSQHDLPLHAEVLRLKAECAAQAGDFITAYRTHQHFYRLEQEATSAQNACQIRAYEVIYRTKEAIRERLSEREHVAELEAHVAELEAHALRDALTGLFNKTYLQHEMARYAAYAQRHTVPLSFILLSIEDYAALRKAHGRSVLEASVKELAKLLQGRLRGFDTVARYSEDELALLLPRTNLGQAVHLSRRLGELINELDWDALGMDAPPAVKFGVSTLKAGDDGEVLRSEAEQALAEAQQLGDGAGWTVGEGSLRV